MKDVIREFIDDAIVLKEHPFQLTDDIGCLLIILVSDKVNE